MVFKHLSPPTIAHPLNSGGEAVAISGHAAGAEIVVCRYYSYGSTSPQVIGTVKAPDTDLFNMKVDPLSYGNYVYAVQVLDGLESKPLWKGEALKVEMPPEPLPPPKVLTPVYSCAKGLGVGNIVNGAIVEILVRRVVSSTDWETVFKGPIGFGTARIMISPLQLRDEVKAIQSFPDVAPAESAVETAVEYPDQRLPSPEIRRPLIECAPSFLVDGLITGATLNIYRSPDDVAPFIQMVALEPTTNVEVSGGLQEGWELTATQELCGERDRSPRSRSVTVEPIAAHQEYPPEILLPVDEHDNFIVVKGLHESSIRVLDARDDLGRDIGGGTCFGRTTLRLDMIVAELAKNVRVIQSLECNGQVFEVRSKDVAVGSSEVSKPLTLEEQQELVNAHNTWRDTKRVRHLKWSDDLAQRAQQWADHLASIDPGWKVKDPNTGEEVEWKPPHSGPGENIFWSGETASPRDAVDAWGSEKEWYNDTTHTCAKDKVCGHYTQIMWSKTEKVGGGRAVSPYREWWVCNYEPAGNFGGDTPY